jgi:hypothetical protein
VSLFLVGVILSLAIAACFGNGKNAQIDAAINHLQDIELEIWDENSVSSW